MNTDLTRAQQTGPPARLVLPEETIGAEQILSLTYSAGCAAETTAPSIGSAVAATVALELAGELPKLEGKSVRLDVGVPDDAGGTVWRSLGHFRFETPQTGEGKTTVTAVDAMLWALEQGYYPSSAAGSTALSILQDICTQAGVTLASTAGITDVAVSGTLEGYTMRELAGYLAALLGRNAIFDADGKLALRWFSASSLTVTTDDYYAGGFTRKDEAWTLAGLAVTTGSGEDDTLTAGATAGTVLRFSNPFMTQSILDGIWSRISGFSFRPGEVNLLGDLRVEPGDLVTVTDLAGDSYTLAVMAVEHQYDGGWKTKLSAYGSAEGDTSAGYQGPTVTAMERYAAEFGSFRQLYAQDLTATNATLANLTAAQANISSLIATKADIEDLTAAAARIDTIESDYITTGWADANFLRAEDILTGSVTGVEISATKYLTGVTILGDVIQAETLTAEKLILTGADGLIYELNAQAGSLTQTQLTQDEYKSRVDGSVLAAHSVTADRINVTDLFAQDITATGKISGLELEGATGSFSGHIAATTGSIAGFTLDGGSMYCHDTYVSSANTEESVTLWFHGIPSQSERGTGSPNLTYEGAWAGNPNSVAASLRVDLEEAPSGGGASGFDRILLEMSRLTDGQRGALAVTVSGCEVTGDLTAESIKSTGYLDASSRIRCYSGSSLSIGSGTGVLLLPEGGIRAQGSGAYISTDGSVNAGTNVTAGGNIAAAGSLSTYGYTVPRIQHGNISVTVTAGSSTNFTISFPKSFPGTPDVIITPRHNSTGANYELTVRLRTVSASNATGVIYCDGGSATWVLHWVAMYG